MCPAIHHSQFTTHRSKLCLLGLPCDSQSSYRKGCAKAPAAIRRIFESDCYNAAADSGADLTGAVQDLGNLAAGASWKETSRIYSRRVRDLCEAGKTPFLLGGDHAITIPIVEALDCLGGAVHVVQLDAHPDLYDEYGGDRFSHACTASRILEMAHVATLTIVGERSMNPPQRQQAAHFGDRLKILPARGLTGPIPPLGHIAEDAPVYLTLDLDVFEPAHAPGVSHPLPGGLTPRQVLDFLADSRFRLVGMDAVEVNPDLDLRGATAVLAARLVQQAMAKAL